jgi:hypothetical protein
MPVVGQAKRAAPEEARHSSRGAAIDASLSAAKPADRRDAGNEGASNMDFAIEIETAGSDIAPELAEQLALLSDLDEESDLRAEIAQAVFVSHGF